ncbi:adenylyl-sulfate kinase [Mechercharimyces sp. CAU 1602]|uniref:adenylyl-sulfate kinase n=1 Tax=Mechercharimyces sp. CAU 1602 TaxID=2973933 RepID=UPI002161F525|nr:adenylyl-sulfate kinase [Mechercharimyces sp. CAU 1602]MCS1351118.1 adenylyl-sulfate kinase [Mechercharimyces sp. CAU 1602]
MRQKGITLWLTGLSGAGKTTIACHAEAILKQRGMRVQRLDGDIVRAGLTKDLGFSKVDRAANIERVAYVSQLLTKHDVIVLASFISPYRNMREHCRQVIDSFAEVYVKCSLDRCVKRDVKGLYKRAINGEIKDFTGISDPYEEPLYPELILDTENESPEGSARNLILFLEKRGVIPTEGEKE